MQATRLLINIMQCNVNVMYTGNGITHPRAPGVAATDDVSTSLYYPWHTPFQNVSFNHSQGNSSRRVGVGSGHVISFMVILITRCTCYMQRLGSLYWDSRRSICLQAGACI